MQMIFGKKYGGADDRFAERHPERSSQLRCVIQLRWCIIAS